MMLAVSLPRVPMMICRSAESKSQTFSSFKDSTHDPFCNDIANEIEEKIQPSPISAAFRCLDLRLFPQDRNKLNNHGLDDLETLRFVWSWAIFNTSSVRKTVLCRSYH